MKYKHVVIVAKRKNVQRQSEYVCTVCNWEL